MKPRTLISSMLLVFVGLLLGSLALNSAGANLQPAPGADVGRYRMTAYAPGGGIYMNDTTTGECWLLNVSSKKWVRAAAALDDK